MSKTVVKPQHFLRAKEGSLNLKSIPFQNSYLFIMMYILLCTILKGPDVLVFQKLGDIGPIPKLSYVSLPKESYILFKPDYAT